MRLVSSTLATGFVLAFLLPAPVTGAGGEKPKLERAAREALKEAAGTVRRGAGRPEAGPRTGAGAAGP